jgi:hypothetical protein
LDLLRFHNNLNDHSLSKLLNACLKSLKVFRLGYGTTGQSLGLGSLSTVALAKCKLLKKLQLGDPEDFHKPEHMENRLFAVKKLFQYKQFNLEYLTLYQADGQIIETLT